GSFFLADETLDFALVAVADPQTAAPFGFLPLVGQTGKVAISEFASIVQHPRGRPKEVALRENRIVDVLPAFLHYDADTEPGSSGSPVFNDQWEVVALHHASTQGAPPAKAVVNEGIRVSELVTAITAANLVDGPARLRNELLQHVDAATPVAPQEAAP